MAQLMQYARCYKIKLVRFKMIFFSRLLVHFIFFTAAKLQKHAMCSFKDMQRNIHALPLPCPISRQFTTFAVDGGY